MPTSRKPQRIPTLRDAEIADAAIEYRDSLTYTNEDRALRNLIETVDVESPPSGSRAPNSLNYPNPKIDALLAGSISLSPGTFTERDFIDLALAALDQAGVSVSLQRRVNELCADEMEVHAACYACELNGFGVDGAACYACELNAKAVR